MSKRRIMEKGNKRKTFPLYIVLSLLAHAVFFSSFFLLGHRLGDRLLGEGRHVGLLFVDLGEIGGGEGGGETKAPEPSPPVTPAPPKLSEKPKSLQTPRRETVRREEGIVSPSSPLPSTGGGPAAGEGGAGSGTPGSGGVGPGGPSGGGSKILAEIRRKIERAKRYPSLARQQEIEGSVRLSFSIEPSGQVSGLTLLGSSGSKLLDEEALATVKRAAPLPYYPNPIRISLKFSLEEE